MQTGEAMTVTSHSISLNNDSAAVADVPVSAVAGNDETHPAQVAVRRWRSLGSIQQRVVVTLAAEVERASQDVENETGKITRIFQDLALKAAAQSQRVAELALLANTVEVDGESLPLGELAGLFEGSLGDIVSKILQLSQHAMAMVYSLDTVSKSMHEVEHCIAEVDAVNRQTRMLAINARIEAARAGVAGLAFGVISDEVRNLSSSTEQLSEAMQTHVGAVLRGLRDSHGALRTVATLDMSENIMAKEKLDGLVVALVCRSNRLGEIAHQAALDAEEISRQVGLAIMSLQFQDRVAQRLAQVTDTLSILGGALADLHADTAAVAADPTAEEAAREAAWLDQLSNRYRLSEMRSVFVAQVVEDVGRDVDLANQDSAAVDGSVELF